MILWFLLISAARAATLESLALARLVSARDAAEVNARRAEFEEMSVALKACAIERDEKTVPLACYQARRLAQSWPSAPAGLPKAEDLDRICEKAARALRVDKGDAKDVSPACRTEIARALKIRAYRDADWPED